MAANPEILKISEIFHSLQGEGASLGIPTAFLRLAHCNLHCSYCDTKYTWDFERYDYEREVRQIAVAELSAELAQAPSRRLVITGGEPLIQQPALIELVHRLPSDFAIELETNGTFVPHAELASRITQWNVSPKLSNAGDPERLRINDAALSALRDTGRAYLKLVVRTETDVSEAAGLVTRLNWPKSRVFFMPEALNADELRARSRYVAESAIARGVRFSTRLHLELWNGRRGT